MNNFSNNWKTTATGIVAGLPQVVNGVQSENWTSVITGICTILLGIFAKDHNVTGS